MKPYRRLNSPLARNRPAMGWKQQIAVGLLIPLFFIVAALQWRWMAGNKASLFRLGGSWYVERLACELCGGIGFVRAEEDPRVLKMCPLCQGRGGAYIRRLNDQDVICPACGGMGRIWDDPESAHFCERCGGRGLIPVEEMATNPPPAGVP